MSNSDNFKYKNRYGYKGLVVLGFERMTVDGKPQIYATGFDLDKPEQKISVALMQEEGFRKQLAQYQFKLVEKTNGQENQYFDLQRKVGDQVITKEEYLKKLHSSAVDKAYQDLISKRSQADNLASKEKRIASFPAVLMFDHANKLGSVGDMEIYEARWVSGISGNNQIKSQLSNENSADTSMFNTMHRKVLGNIQLKYNESDKPYWGEINAVDRITTLEPPKPIMDSDEKSALCARNRDIFRIALSNKTVSPEGYEAERKPFVCVNILDSSKKHLDTVRVYAEEELDDRYKDGDATQKMIFKRPRDANATVEAYMYRQDTFSRPLQERLESDVPLNNHDKKYINDAYKSDKTRAVLSALFNFSFNPLITKNLAEQASSPEIKSDISIKSNALEHFYKQLCLGEVTPRLVSGTTYAIGPKYLERFENELKVTDNNRLRPSRGMLNTQITPTDDPEQFIERFIGYTQDKKLIFNEMYICPTKFDPTSDKSSTYVGLITTPYQQFEDAKRNQILHTDLAEKHAPSIDSVRFISHEYQDYANGKLEAPSVVKLFEQEKERIHQIESESDSKVAYDTYYRLLGVHTPPVEEPKEQSRKQEKTKELDNSLSFGL